MQNLQTAQTNNDNVWQLTRLVDVGQLVTGNTPRTSNREYYDKDYLPWVTPPDLGDGIRVNTTKKYLSKKGAEVARVLPKGAVMISCIGNLGKVGIAEKELATNQQINSVIFNNNVLPEYGFYYCLTLKNWLIEHSSQTTIAIVNKGRLENAPFLLTSLDKQKEIVDHLNSIYPEVPIVVAKINKAKILVDKFRQSILSAAITGKLTEGWREKNLQKPVSEIVNNLKTKRLQNQDTAAKKKKIENLYKYKEENDTDGLPEGWSYVALDKLCESFQYGTSKKSDQEGKVPVLRMGNLQNGEIDWASLVFTSDASEIEKYKLEAGNVLFNRTNSPELVGKTSIYRGERPAIFAGYHIKVNNYPVLNSEYLNYCLNSQHERNFCFQVKTDGVSQ